MRDRVFVILSGVLLVAVVLGGCAYLDSLKEPAPEATNNDESNNDATNNDVDPCLADEENWYNDGECDFECWEPDPDCEGIPCDADENCPDTFSCDGGRCQSDELNNDEFTTCLEDEAYGDGVCDADCEQPDPDCTGELCADDRDCEYDLTCRLGTCVLEDCNSDADCLGPDGFGQVRCYEQEGGAPGGSCVRACFDGPMGDCFNALLMCNTAEGVCERITCAGAGDCEEGQSCSAGGYCE